MYIEYVFGPKSGTKEHVSREDARTLILGGFAREAVEPPKPIEPPKWGVYVGALFGAVSLVFQCDACKSTLHFGGNPNAEGWKENIERVLCVHAHGSIPNSARDAYRAALKGKHPATANGQAAAAGAHFCVPDGTFAQVKAEEAQLRDRKMLADQVAKEYAGK